MLKRIATAQVRIGMFLHSVDAGWLNNPFWRSRFRLTDSNDLALLRESGVATVVIDLARGLDVAAAEPAAPPPSVEPASCQQAFSLADPPAMSPAAAAKAARERAAEIIAQSKEKMKVVFADARLGRTIEMAAVRSMVDEIASSVQAHPQALIGMVRLKSKDEYTYLHSVAVCALMIGLARELDVAEEVVRDMGLAGLLHDIGKMAVSNAILNKPGKLDDAEFAVIRTHPSRGGEMLLTAHDIPAVALDVCLHHHEKVDGTGYPFRLKGDEISLAARIGAVCDVYDALTSDRAYKAGWSPADAVTAMNGWEGQFDRTVLFAFYRSIAVFPTGMLVRMRSGHLGIVIPNGRRASRPRIRMFYDLGERTLIRPEDISLGGTDGSREIVAEADPADWPPRNWPEFLAHLLVESDAINLTAIAGLWYCEVAKTAVPDRTADKVRLWQPGG